MNDLARSDMSSTPETQPVLLYGGTVLTMNERAEVLPNAEILIQQGRIAAIGRAITAAPGTRLVDVQGCFILPGLIQGHVHLGQTFFRGLAEQRPLLPWLRQRIWPLEAAHDEESAYWCTLLGAVECLLGGTTTVQDMGLGPGVRGLLKALLDSRLRAFAGKCLMDAGEGLPTALAEETDRTLSDTETLGSKLDGAGNGRLRYALNPRFILSCSDQLWQGVRELAAKYSWPVHTHALEQKEESELVRGMKGGRDEIEYFDSTGILGTDLRIAHGVWLPQTHYERLRSQRFAVVHCPSSNLKLGSGIADVVGLQQAGIATGIGCDATACCNHLDAFSEIRLAALLQSNRHGPQAFSGIDALRLATSEGARALGLSHEIGSIEVGKRADLVVLRRGCPELWASSQADPHDIIAFSATRANVSEVYVDGEQLVENGRATHLDVDKINRQADRFGHQVLDRSGLFTA